MTGGYAYLDSLKTLSAKTTSAIGGVPLFLLILAIRWSASWSALVLPDKDFESPPDVFICYARSDGANFAEWLAQRLNQMGLAVWLDRSHLEGGRNWEESIERAIASCDSLVAVLTKSSLASRVCRAEIGYALYLNKTVVPLMLERVTPPLRLIDLQYLSFTDRSKYDHSVSMLIRSLKSQPAWHPELNARSAQGMAENVLRRQDKPLALGVPPLPRNFVPRPVEQEALRKMMQSVVSDKRIAITALHGMDGIGKSVVAAAICHDPIVQAAFPDGTIWLQVGREPDLLTLVSTVAEALGDSRPPSDTLEEGARRLREFVRDRAVLIVLDDIWRAEDAEPFLPNRPGSCFIITTRNLDVARALNSEVVAVGALASEQAQDLLQQQAGRDDPEIAQIGVELGHSPLTLGLAGAMLKRGMSGTELLQRLRAAPIADTTRQANKSLRASLDLTLEQLTEPRRSLFYLLGIFPEDSEIPQSVVTRLWHRAAPRLSEYECDALIEELANYALINLEPRTKSIRLHDLIRSYLRERLGSSLREANVQLSDVYELSGSRLETATDDYMRRHLPYHLIEAGRNEALCALLTDSPRWMQSRFELAKSDAAYVGDLELAMSLLVDPLSPRELVSLIRLVGVCTSLPTTPYLVVGWCACRVRVGPSLNRWWGQRPRLVAQAGRRAFPGDGSVVD